MASIDDAGKQFSARNAKVKFVAAHNNSERADTAQTKTINIKRKFNNIDKI